MQCVYNLMMIIVLMTIKVTGQLSSFKVQMAYSYVVYAPTALYSIDCTLLLNTIFSVDRFFFLVETSVKPNLFKSWLCDSCQNSFLVMWNSSCVSFLWFFFPLLILGSLT